jgi:tetratricopeptide (TPR) repeat protein
LINVSLQLLRNSWNQNANGGMWEYWFSLPGGYIITHYKDKRLEAAAEILSSVMRQELDPKNRYFTYEIYAYIKLIQGNTLVAKEYYEKAISNPSESYGVSYNRAKEMLNRIKAI